MPTCPTRWSTISSTTPSDDCADRRHLWSRRLARRQRLHVVDDVGVLTICGDEDHVNQDDVFRLVRNALNPLILDVFLNSVAPVFSVPLAALEQINVFGVGGNDELIVDDSNGLIDVRTESATTATVPVLECPETISLAAIRCSVSIAVSTR